MDQKWGTFINLFRYVTTPICAVAACELLLNESLPRGVMTCAAAFSEKYAKLVKKVEPISISCVAK